jgi:hypothetical protein
MVEIGDRVTIIDKDLSSAQRSYVGKSGTVRYQFDYDTFEIQFPDNNKVIFFDWKFKKFDSALMNWLNHSKINADKINSNK